MIAALNSAIPQGQKPDIDSEFIYGTSSSSLQSGAFNFIYENGNVTLDFNKSANWSFFWIGTYNKTVMASVTNSINEDATIDIPVEKVWLDGDNTSRPLEITVQLYKKTANGEEVPVQELTLSEENDWKGSFSELPYWDGNSRIEYVVKEIKVGDNPIENSGYQSSVSGDADDGFVITNTLAWQLVKISSSTGEDDSKLYLGGAEFIATRQDGSKVYYGKSETNTGIIQWYEDSAFDNGIGTMLPNGNYTIAETKAPTGYQITTPGWNISIENGYPTSVTQSGDAVESGKEGNMDTFYLENEPLYGLPSAGSSGIFGYMMGGTLLLMAGTLILYKMKRKEVQGS